MRTNDGNYVMCSTAGKICYTEREAGSVINGCKKHIHVGSHQWVKSAHGNSKLIPRRKYYCKECGFFHLTHMALYSSDSRNCTWEEIFYREYEKKQKQW